MANQLKDFMRLMFFVPNQKSKAELEKIARVEENRFFELDNPRDLEKIRTLFDSFMNRLEVLAGGLINRGPQPIARNQYKLEMQNGVLVITAPNKTEVDRKRIDTFLNMASKALGPSALREPEQKSTAPNPFKTKLRRDRDGG